MSTIVTRAVKGTALTYTEMDANFNNLNTDKLEAGTPGTNIANTPAGGISAVTVQAAINELDTEKANLVSPTFTGNPTAPTPTVGDNDTSIATTAFITTALTPFTGKNRIINGAMLVSQRTTSGTITAGTTVPTATTGYGAGDRFFSYCTGANTSLSQVNGDDATSKRLQITGAASVTAIGLGQRIAAKNSYDLAGGSATLSVDLANSLLTTVTWTVSYAKTTDAFGTIGMPTKTQIATGNFTVNSTVTRYNTTFTVPSAAVTGIEILFTVDAQTSGTFTVGRVQLESGSIATNFENRLYESEYELCQAYYQTVYTYLEQPVTNSQDYSAVAYGLIEMRATPNTSSSTNTLATSFPAAVGTIGIYGTKTVYERRRANATAAGSFSSTINLQAEIP